ncbi:MAG: hypothetical protein V4760_14235 [Bdellovibrionota bacterium]
MSELLSFANAFRKKKNKSAWNAFFAHLSSAQIAAADECHELAIDLESEGRFDLADHYRVFESEERAHATAIRSLCTEWVDLNRKEKRLYREKLVGKTTDNFEKMAILHFSLDTSFLTLLGSIHRNADTLFTDPDWAERVRAKLAPIVRDEVFHLNEGQEMTIALSRTRPTETKQKLKKRLTSHQRRVAKTVSRLFSGTNVPENWLSEMNANYKQRFERSIDAIVN